MKHHDCWNIPSFTSPKNLFRELSAIKEEGYSFTLNKPYGVYSFIAIDGCPETGAGRPLNFFASLDTIDMDFLASMLIKGLEEDHNHTFAFSHYPISTSYYGRTSDGLGFWDITHHVSVWLSGHLHKLAGGLGETMYAFMDGKVLELELGDMKKHGMFRIVVVDNDMVSFVDLPIESKLELPLHVDHDFVEEFTRGPILVITNPKDGRYMMSGKEPFRNIRHSTHIRVLVWSDTTTEENVVEQKSRVTVFYLPRFQKHIHQSCFYLPQALQFVEQWVGASYPFGSLYVVDEPLDFDLFF